MRLSINSHNQLESLQRVLVRGEVSRPKESEESDGELRLQDITR